MVCICLYGYLNLLLIIIAGVMKTWHPEINDRMGEVIEACCNRSPNNPSHLIQPPSHRVNFTGIHLNVPSKENKSATCFDHGDCQDFIFSHTAIINGGNFDYRRGGHLVLHDIKVILEFPPGVIIAFPGSMIRHSNVPVAAHEDRVSLSCYNAGGVVRFFDNGMELLKGKKIVCDARWTKLKREGDKWVHN